MGEFTGKKVIVTGGASGIGRAVVRLFAEEGASVAIFDQDEPGGLTLAAEIRSQGGEALFVSLDVSLAHECARAVQKVIDTFGKVDVLVYSQCGIRLGTHWGAECRRLLRFQSSRCEYDTGHGS